MMKLKKIAYIITAVAVVVSSALTAVPVMAENNVNISEWDFENTVFDGNTSDDGLYRWPTTSSAEIVNGGGINGTRGFKLATSTWSQLYKQGLELTSGVYEFGASVKLTATTPHVLFRFGSGEKADGDNTAFTIAEINNGEIKLIGNQDCEENKTAKTINADTWYTLDAIVDLDSNYCLVTVTDVTGKTYAKNRYTITNSGIGWFGFNIPYSESISDVGNVYIDNMYIKSFADDEIVLVDDDFSSYTSDVGDKCLPYFGGGYPNGSYKRSTASMVNNGKLTLSDGYALKYAPTTTSAERGWLNAAAPFVSIGKLKIEFTMNVSSGATFTVDIKDISRQNSITPVYADTNALVDSSTGTKFTKGYMLAKDVDVTILYDTETCTYTTTMQYDGGESETLTGQTKLTTGVTAVWLNVSNGNVTIDNLKITNVINETTNPEEPVPPQVINGVKATIAGSLDGAQITDDVITRGEETVSVWTLTSDLSDFNSGTLKVTLNNNSSKEEKIENFTQGTGEAVVYVFVNRAADEIESVVFTPTQIVD